jgi:hypothetical protein
MPADQLLVALLDTIIPAEEGMPGAGEAGLAERVLADAADGPLGEALRRLLAALPDGFAALPLSEREHVLRDLGDTATGDLDAVVNLVYTAYYTDPGVLARIEAATGYHAEPPQPHGYRLEPLNPELLDRVRRIPPSWRKA